MDKFQEILEILQEATPIPPEKMLEYAFGSKFSAARYLQRFGAPGHYTYVYSPDFMRRYGRKASFFFSRFLKKSQRFVNKIKMRYDAVKVDVKPQSLTTAILSVHRQDGQKIDFGIDLKKHSIYSYRSHRGITGGATKLSKAKRSGVLRYR